MEHECGLCHEFTVKLSKVTKGQMYSIIRLTTSYLKDLSDDGLLELYTIIRDGAKVCDNCAKMCSAIPGKCQDLGYKKNMGHYKARIEQAKKDMVKIEDEVHRRSNLRKAAGRK